MAPRVNPEAKSNGRPQEFEFERLPGWSEEEDWDNGMVTTVLYSQPWWRTAQRVSAAQAAS